MNVDWTPSSEPIGKKRRDWSVVNATSVLIEIAPLPLAIVQPANQYTSAGMTAKVVWMAAIIQRPVIRLRTSRSARRLDPLPALGKVVGTAHRLAEQDARHRQRLLHDRGHVRQGGLQLLRHLPALVPDALREPDEQRQEREGEDARRQSRSNMAPTVASTVVTFETTDVAVEVTTVSMPPMSLAIRLWTSPWCGCG